MIVHMTLVSNTKSSEENIGMLETVVMVAVVDLRLDRCRLCTTIVYKRIHVIVSSKIRLHYDSTLIASSIGYLPHD